MLFQEMMAVYSDNQPAGIDVYVDGARLRLWSWPPTGLLFIQSWYIKMEQRWDDIDRGNPKNLLKKPVSVPLCPPQISDGITRTFAARGRRLTTWAKTRPFWESYKCQKHKTQIVKADGILYSDTIVTGVTHMCSYVFFTLCSGRRTIYGPSVCRVPSTKLLIWVIVEQEWKLLVSRETSPHNILMKNVAELRPRMALMQQCDVTWRTSLECQCTPKRTPFRSLCQTVFKLERFGGLFYFSLHASCRSPWSCKVHSPLLTIGFCSSAAHTKKEVEQTSESF
jgi:hypothetical protein